MTSKVRHLSPISIFIFWGQLIYNWWIFILMGWGWLAGSVGQFKWLFLGLIILLLIIFAVIRYLRFTFSLGEQLITINSGIFLKQTRHIPYSNIQTVQEEQWIFLKPFGLENITIETAGKEEKHGEARLLTVSKSVATEIEARRKKPAQSQSDQLVSKVTSSATTVDSPTTYTINGSDLNRYALTSLSFLPIILGLLWLVNKIQELVPKSFLNSFNAQLVHLSLVIIIFIVFLIITIGFLISYLNVIQKYYRFTLTSAKQSLTTVRGFFQRKTVGIRLSKIQAIDFKQNVIRQLAHLSTVQSLIASNASDDENGHNLVIIPVIKETEALARSQRFVEWLPQQINENRFKFSPRAWFFIRNSVLIYLTIVAFPLVLAYFFWSVAFLYVLPFGIFLLFVGYFQGRYVAKNTGFQVVSKNLIVTQTGYLWTRRRSFIQRDKIQSIRLKQSIWMEPKKLTHIEFNLRKGNDNDAIQLRYLSVTDAETILKWYQPQVPSN